MTRKETPKPADTLASAAPLHSPQPAVVPQTTGANRPGAELITRYFPDLTAVQQQRFTALEGLYREWNTKINVISRKDIDLLYLHHVLHSLAIAKVCSFSSGARILDVGCGGGFPGIPLAILFPETQFTLIDSIGKKIKVVNEVAQGIGLRNLSLIHI